jgi:DNA-binding transcriptional regulator GbsR (MarR family)
MLFKSIINFLVAETKKNIDALVIVYQDINAWLDKDLEEGTLAERKKNIIRLILAIFGSAAVIIFLVILFLRGA